MKWFNFLEYIELYNSRGEEKIFDELVSLQSVFIIIVVFGHNFLIDYLFINLYISIGIYTQFISKGKTL